MNWKISSALNLRNPRLQNLAAYALAAAIISYLARGIPVVQMMASLRQANLWIFVPASLASFLCWFAGETLLFSLLFSYFHRRTTFAELIPANAAQYFLQLVNMLAAGGALVLFLHRRKRVPWLAGGCTLMFQGFMDWLILATLAVVAALLVPSSKIWLGLPFALGSLVVWFAIAAFFGIGRPRFKLGRWIYTRPSLVSFRTARPRHYRNLAMVRAPMFVFQGFVLYAQLLGFHIHVPLSQVLAFMPAVLAIGGLPITPVGMGPLQAVLMAGFSAYAGKADLLTMSIAISAMNVLIRIPLGLGSAGAFAHEVSSAENGQKDLAERQDLEEAVLVPDEEIEPTSAAGPS